LELGPNNSLPKLPRGQEAEMKGPIKFPKKVMKKSNFDKEEI